MNALEITDLSKTYPSFELKDLTLTLPSGCIMGLIGKNGAGKSTTIRLILNMIRSDKGSVRILGKENKAALPLLLEDVGVVLDEVGLPECLTARQVGNIMRQTFRQWDERCFLNLLHRLELPDNKPFREFSRGMKMKLGIAVAMSHNAKLLILDEATGGLDPIVRDQVIDLFADFTRQEDRAILMSSHIVSDLEKICDYIAFLHDGRLLLMEEKDALFERYGIYQGTSSAMERLPAETIKGKRVTPYGVEALVLREELPDSEAIKPITIEELFIFLAKENQ